MNAVIFTVIFFFFLFAQLSVLSSVKDLHTRRYLIPFSKAVVISLILTIGEFLAFYSVYRIFVLLDL